MPVSKKLQEIQDSITEDRQVLINAVSGLSSNQLDYKRAEDQWSISDILHHLALTGEASAKLGVFMLKQAEEMNVPPDPTPDQSVLDCLDSFGQKIRGMKAQAPDRVVPRSQITVEESLAKLDQSRQEMLAEFEQLSKYDLTHLVRPHPVGGDFHMYQWLLIAGRHERRHVGQIEKIKASPDFPTE